MVGFLFVVLPCALPILRLAWKERRPCCTDLIQHRPVVATLRVKLYSAEYFSHSNLYSKRFSGAESGLSHRPRHLLLLVAVLYRYVLRLVVCVRNSA